MHSEKGQNLWELNEGHLFLISKHRLRGPDSEDGYNSIAIWFVDVDDVTKGRNYIDVDASKFK